MSPNTRELHSLYIFPGSGLAEVLETYRPTDSANAPFSSHFSLRISLRGPYSLVLGEFSIKGLC